MAASKGRALVTGGAGLIGSHLTDLLLEQGYEVTVLDNLEAQTHPKGKPGWIHPEAGFIQGDVRSVKDLSSALRGVRFVFHQAAFGGFTQELSKYIDVNVIGTARIFELLATGKFKVEKVVVASSQAVYGEGAYECTKDGPQFPAGRSPVQLQKKEWEHFCPCCREVLKSVPTPEEKMIKGGTAYALSKEFEERLALSYGEKLKIPVVALRYAVTYGPRQSIFNPYTGVASIFSTRLHNGLPPLIYEDGEQTRDFIYVGDVARANLFVLENQTADGQIFNVGTGQPTPIAVLARTLASIYKKSTAPEISQTFRWGDVRHLRLDAGKLKRLGFSPAVPLEEGLTHFTQWFRTQEEFCRGAHGKAHVL